MSSFSTYPWHTQAPANLVNSVEWGVKQFHRLLSAVDMSNFSCDTSCEWALQAHGGHLLDKGEKINQMRYSQISKHIQMFGFGGYSHMSIISQHSPINCKVEAQYLPSL